MTSAIVTRATSPKALVVTRSLGRKGVEVITADHVRHGVASLSKYSRGFFLYPSPQADPERFVETLVEFARERRPDVIIPTHSEDTYLIARHRERLSPYVKVPLHDYDTIAAVNDKGRLAETARKLGVPVPATYQPRDLRDLGDLAAGLEYPAVIKLRGSASSLGLSYARSRGDLVDKYADTVRRFGLGPADYPIVQEYIPGDGYGVSLLYNHGALRAQFTHRRIREYPLSGGPSTCRVSVRHPVMEGYARTLLEHYAWHGVAMVEFKLDRRTGVPYLLEVNPRIWGSVYQAVASGVDFPYLLYRMAIDGDVEPVLTYREGVVTRNCFLDCASLLGHVVREGDLAPLRELFRAYRDDVVTIDDMKPALGFTFSALKAGLKT